MEKNVLDKFSDSYDEIHLKESEINVGNGTFCISPKLKLILGWSIFVLSCVLAYIALTLPNKKMNTKNQQDILTEQQEDTEQTDLANQTLEKDADSELNAFIEQYFTAITSCDNESLKDMVTDPTVYTDNESLLKKSEFITGYKNITVYTKKGVEENAYVVFVVANLTIAGVNSSPYDIVTLYVLDGARGYLINNDKLSAKTQEYIAGIKQEDDVQELYQLVNDENNELKSKDASLREFYEIISRRNVETNTAEVTEDNLISE